MGRGSRGSTKGFAKELWSSGGLNGVMGDGGGEGGGGVPVAVIGRSRGLGGFLEVPGGRGGRLGNLKGSMGPWGSSRGVLKGSEGSSWRSGICERVLHNLQKTLWVLGSLEGVRGVLWGSGGLYENSKGLWRGS